MMLAAPRARTNSPESSDTPSSVHAPVVAAVATTLSRVGTEAWDAFADGCGASMRSSSARLRAAALRRLLSRRLRIFELFLDADGGRTKIGQCAVSTWRRGGVFIDRLLLSNDHADLWPQAMEAVLAQLGAGHYMYGWELSLEPSRENDIAALPQVHVENVRPLVVQAIDFSQAESWERYYKSVSENSRRNAKAALRDMPEISVEFRDGLSAMAIIPDLIRLRSEQSRRKGLNLVAPRLALSLVGTMATAPQRVMSASAKHKGKTLSACYGWRSGDTYWYLDSGSEPNNGGAAWLLLLELIRREYEIAPAGRFVMGYVDYALHDEERSAGLLRSRYACRVTDYATSVVLFEYAPG